MLVVGFHGQGVIIWVLNYNRNNTFMLNWIIGKNCDVLEIWAHFSFSEDDAEAKTTELKYIIILEILSENFIHWEVKVWTIHDINVMYCTALPNINKNK